MTWRTSRLIQVHRSVKLSCGNCITLAHHQGSSPMMRLSAILTMAGSRLSCRTVWLRHGACKYGCKRKALMHIRPNEMHSRCLLLWHLKRLDVVVSKTQQPTGIAGVPRAPRGLSRASGPSSGTDGPGPPPLSAQGPSPGSDGQGGSVLHAFHISSELWDGSF